jgi:hypothetical protein
MRQLKSHSQDNTTERLSFSVFWILFGLLGVLVGLSAIPHKLTGRGGINWSDFPILALIAWAAFIALGAFRQAKLARKLGVPQASISDFTIRPGEKFHFFYQQECRQNLTVQSVGVFLVFRERVTYDDGIESNPTEDFDRLVQQFMHDGRVYSSGELIREEHIFHIPQRPMGIRNPYMGKKDAHLKTAWVVKVLIDLGVGSQFWKEYEVEVTGEVTGDRANSASQTQNAEFDIFLMGTRFRWIAFWRITNAMRLLLPHLRDNQIGALYFGRPSLLLERVAHDEAQRVKAILEGAGACVELKPTTYE